MIWLSYEFGNIKGYELKSSVSEGGLTTSACMLSTGLEQFAQSAVKNLQNMSLKPYEM